MPARLDDTCKMSINETPYCTHARGVQGQGVLYLEGAHPYQPPGGVAGSEPAGAG